MKEMMLIFALMAMSGLGYRIMRRVDLFRVKRRQEKLSRWVNQKNDLRAGNGKPAGRQDMDLDGASMVIKSSGKDYGGKILKKVIL
ncbi:MAG: hypothetical protein HFG78_09410 [Hungatella sp.]|nr:hypothetical protein [Hungatella sp.]MCI9637834.1 hypothetical protein [Hungatella sp.]